MIELVGLLPSKILDFTRAAFEDWAPSSSLTWSSVFPKASALHLDLSTIKCRRHSSSLGLGEEVGKQNLVVFAVSDRVECLHRCKEVAVCHQYM